MVIIAPLVYGLAQEPNQNTAVVGTRTASGNLAIETYNGGVWGERLRIRSDGKLTTQSAGMYTPPLLVEVYLCMEEILI